MMSQFWKSRAAGYILTMSAIDGRVKRSERFLKCPASNRWWAVRTHYVLNGSNGVIETHYQYHIFIQYFKLMMCNFNMNSLITWVTFMELKTGTDWFHWPNLKCFSFTKVNLTNEEVFNDAFLFTGTSPHRHFLSCTGNFNQPCPGCKPTSLHSRLDFMKVLSDLITTTSS